MASILSLLLLASLTSASPLSLSSRQKTLLDYPPRIFASAFTLIANVSSLPPSISFNPHNWPLTFERVGAGQNAAILSPAAPSGAILFLNGTSRDISAEATSIMAPPLNTTVGVVPLGLQFKSAPDGDFGYIGVNYGMGDIGAGIGIGLRDPYARLFAPARLGSRGFVVCREGKPTYGRPEYAVYIWKGVNVDKEECVKIQLLAQCAELPDLAGEEELNIVNTGVGCYESVKGIEWEKW